MQDIMVNRKIFWEFWVFSTFAETFYLFTFCFFAFLLFWIVYRKRKQTQKAVFFCRFCPKMSVFVANKVLIFSDLSLYRANNTLPPRFWHSQGMSALVRFFFFLFLFFL